VPSRFIAPLRRIDSAVFDYCRYGGPSFFSPILAALGNAERELSLDIRWPKDKGLRPLSGLRSQWLDAANDGTIEFEIARCLASIHDHEGKIEPIRGNLEPVTTWRSPGGPKYADWADKGRTVAWTAGDLSSSLANVLARRVMDGKRAGCTDLPVQFHTAASLNAVQAYVAGQIDEQRLEDLLWGLVAVGTAPPGPSPPRGKARTPPLPRAYALLKLLFLPGPLPVGDVDCRIAPEPGVLPLLPSGRVGEACRLAMRRLAGAGLTPLAHRVSGGRRRDDCWSELDGQEVMGRRIAAALLLPLSNSDVAELRKLVMRSHDVSSNPSD